jgi:hypothetical protein
MAAYLQRLLDTAAQARIEPIGLTPVVRSSSPVFEQNQLLGLEEQVAAPSEAAPAETPRRGRSEPWQHPVSRASDPACDVPGAAASALGAAGRAPPAGLPGVPAAAAAGQDVFLAQGDAPAPRPDPAPVVETAIEPAGKLGPSRARAAPPIEPTPIAPPGPSAAAAEPARAAQPLPPASARRRAQSVAETVDAGRREENQPRPAVEREELEVHVPPARPSDIPALDPPAILDPAPERPPIELSPRPPADPVPVDAPREAQADRAEPAQPTITIGQITVEIVDDVRPGSAAARPLTAESASVIGPLGQARAARRLIALRRL